MDRRAFLAKLAAGVPIVGLGGGALLKSTAAIANPTDHKPIYVANEYGTGASDVAAAITAASNNQCGLIFEPDTIFSVGNIVMDGGITGLPTFMYGYGATLFAVNTGTMLQIGAGGESFEFAGFSIDTYGGAGAASTAIQLIGANNYTFKDLYISSFIGESFQLDVTTPDSSRINGCLFENISIGQNTSGGNVFKLQGSVDDVSDLYNNTFINCGAEENYPSTGNGWYMDSVYNNTFINCTSTASVGFSIDNTTSALFLGCSTYLCTTSFALTSNSSGVVVIGGQHPGSFTGNELDQGNVFIISTGSSDNFAYSPNNGQLQCGRLCIPNAVADTHTPSGATAYAYPIYNQDNTLLGYIPIYGSKW